MLLNDIQDSKTIIRKTLNEIFTKSNKVIYIIEKNFQRPLVWDNTNINVLWCEIKEMLTINFTTCDEKPYDAKYCELGQMDTSDLDICNRKYYSGVPTTSIVDASQRTRIVLCLLCAFLYHKDKYKENEYIDLSFLKDKNGNFKLNAIGDDGIHTLYSFLMNTTIQIISKNRDNISVYQRKLNGNSEKDLINVFYYFTHLIEMDIINENYDIEECIDIILKNVYFYVEFIPIERKFDRFLDRNSKGTPISDDDLFTKYLVNLFGQEHNELLYKHYLEFKKLADACDEKGVFTKTKTGDNCLIFIMQEVMKIKLFNIVGDNVFSSSYNLRDCNYGISNLIREKIYFRNVDEVVDYFNTCCDMAMFLLEDSVKLHEDSSFNTFYFQQFGKKKGRLWWYFIKPCYLAVRILSKEKREFIIDIMYRSLYSYYIINRGVVNDTNSQQMINTVEKVSYEILNNKDSEINYFKSIITKLIYSYCGVKKGKENYFNEIKLGVKRLCYGIESNINPMKEILIALEYFLIKKYNLGETSLYKFYVPENINEVVNLDHVLPKNKSTNEHINDIGNGVLLESNLNKSKQDDSNDNNKVYLQSSFITTNLMTNDFIGSFSRDFLNKISNEPFIKRYDVTTINNPDEDFIKERTEIYSNFIINFFNKYKYGE